MRSWQGGDDGDDGDSDDHGDGEEEDYHHDLFSFEH